jgi:hypothetical protein
MRTDVQVLLCQGNAHCLIEWDRRAALVSSRAVLAVAPDDLQRSLTRGGTLTFKRHLVCYDSI